MEYLQVKNWGKWQSYRSDRGTPPWIKVHRNLMSSATWAGLKDHDKGHLVSIWLVAADRDGVVPSNPDLLRKVCMLDHVPDVNKFIDLGFLEPVKMQDGVMVASSWRQDDSPETETETETETERAEKPRKPKKTGKRLPKNWQPSKELQAWAKKERSDLDIKRVIDSFTDYWIAKTGTAATKLDWDATFRNWVRNEKSNRSQQAGNGQRETPVQRRSREAREAIAELDGYA